jgi:DNA-binding NarL/FixJ family response regulator
VTPRPEFLLVPDEAGLDRARARAARRGRSVLPLRVGDLDTARQAVLTALSGADLALYCSAPDDVVDQLLEDLARLGDVRWEEGGPRLDADEVVLLELLRDGLSLGEAATRLHLSRRTADRRLARARAALEVKTTAEALVRATAAGLLAPARRP